MIDDGRTKMLRDKVYIHCPECDKLLVSLTRHDFQMCSCPAETHIDGGSFYTKVGSARYSEIVFKRGDFLVDTRTKERLLVGSTPLPFLQSTEEEVEELFEINKPKD